MRIAVGTDERTEAVDAVEEHLRALGHQVDVLADGDPWPSVGVRLEMMEEAIEVIRLLHKGKMISHHGAYYEVQEARIYTLPEQPVPIYVSAFGPQAAELAGRIGDGMCTTMPGRA